VIGLGLLKKLEEVLPDMLEYVSKESTGTLVKAIMHVLDAGLDTTREFKDFRIRLEDDEIILNGTVRTVRRLAR